MLSSTEELSNIIDYAYSKDHRNIIMDIVTLYLNKVNFFHKNIDEIKENELVRINENIIFENGNYDKKYIWNILEKLSIIIYYHQPLRFLGLAISDYLILHISSKANKTMITSNICFYIQKPNNMKLLKTIASADKMNIDDIHQMYFRNNKNIDNLWTPPVLQFPVEEKYKYYNPLNPSILKTKDGYMINIRYVNYHQENATHWHVHDKDGKVRTENIIFHCDKEMNMLSAHKIIDDSWISNPDNDTSSCYVLGMEDIILFRHSVDHSDTDDGQIYFITNVIAAPPYRSTQRLGILPPLSDDGNYHITDMITLKGPGGFDRIEKNWMYCPDLKNIINNNNNNISDKTIGFIYYHEPMSVVTCKLDTMDENRNRNKNKNHIIETEYILCGNSDNINMFSEHNNNNNNSKDNRYDFGRFRGSGSPVKIGDVYISVVHEVIFKGGNRGRIYTHRFVLYNKSFQVEGVSHPWIFDHVGIEFCRSIALNHSNDNLMLCVGIEDIEARVYGMSIDAIMGMII